jgi:ATP-dependent helicase/DNAse subunit B
MERGVVRIERRILSPTAINTYLSCPRKYYLRYIRKLRTKPSIHLIRGNLIHKTIQAFHKECARGPPGLSETEISESLLKTFNRLWLESQKDLDALGLSQDELDEYRDDSERMLLNYTCWFTRQDSPPLVNYSEVKIFSDYLQLMGIIDAVKINGNEVTLIDYKTSKNPTVTDEIMRQAVLYALLYQDRYNRAPDIVYIHFLKDPGDPIAIHIDELFLEYAEILLESVREKTRTKEENAYLCTCGGYCERDFSN